MLVCRKMGKGLNVSLHQNQNQVFRMYVCIVLAVAAMSISPDLCILVSTVSLFVYYGCIYYFRGFRSFVCNHLANLQKNWMTCYSDTFLGNRQKSYFNIANQHCGRQLWGFSVKYMLSFRMKVISQCAGVPSLLYYVFRTNSLSIRLFQPTLSWK